MNFGLKAYVPFQPCLVIKDPTIRSHYNSNRYKIVQYASYSNCTLSPNFVQSWSDVATPSDLYKLPHSVRHIMCSNYGNIHFCTVAGSLRNRSTVWTINLYVWFGMFAKYEFVSWVVFYVEGCFYEIPIQINFCKLFSQLFFKHVCITNNS